MVVVVAFKLWSVDIDGLVFRLVVHVLQNITTRYYEVLRVNNIYIDHYHG